MLIFLLQGKKSISKKTITKKRKSVMKPAVPEFQVISVFICINLNFQKAKKQHISRV